MACLIAIPLGLVIGHTGRGRFFVVNLAGAARAIPSLGLLYVMVLWLVPQARRRLGLPRAQPDRAHRPGDPAAHGRRLRRRRRRRPRCPRRGQGDGHDRWPGARQGRGAQRDAADLLGLPLGRPSRSSRRRRSPPSPAPAGSGASSSTARRSATTRRWPAAPSSWRSSPSWWTSCSPSSSATSCRPGLTGRSSAVTDEQNTPLDVEIQRGRVTVDPQPVDQTVRGVRP